MTNIQNPKFMLGDVVIIDFFGDGMDMRMKKITGARWIADDGSWIYGFEFGPSGLPEKYIIKKVASNQIIIKPRAMGWSQSIIKSEKMNETEIKT